MKSTSSFLRPEGLWTRRLGLAALALMAAALVASQTYLSMLHHGHAWWRLFTWQAVSWSFWAVFGLEILRRGERLARSPKPLPRVSDLVLCMALVSAHVVLSAVTAALVQPFEPVETMDVARAIRYLSMPWLFVDFLVFALIYFAGHFGEIQSRMRDFAVRESRLEAELARVQLDGLRLKMQPHFLFNTLNSVAALVRRGSNEEALDTVVGLSRLLRRSLETSEAQLVPLEEELAFVNDYVELQSRRFSDRLAFQASVPDECLSVEIPSLFL